MAEERICVLSIAGFDPSGGAGILADIKTFEANKVCGMGAVSALTFQNDIEFDSVKWISTDEILKQVSVLQKRFQFNIIKIGLIKDLETLNDIISFLPIANCKIIWDPIIKASAGFEFHKSFNKEKLFPLLKNIFLITPNTDEVQFLTGINDPMEAAKELSKYCNVLLKGGHSIEEQGVDYLFMQYHTNSYRFEKIIPTENNIYPKHGSGCVLSSAIVANLAKENDLTTSCHNAKKYIEQFLASNPSLLGVHHV